MTCTFSLCAFLPARSQALPDSECSSRFRKVQRDQSTEPTASEVEAKKVIAQDEFEKGRGISQYKMAFRDDLDNAFDQLQKKGGSWLDSGGGVGKAIQDVLSSDQFKQHPNFNATLVSYKTPAQSNSRLKVLSDRFLEDIDAKELDPGMDLHEGYSKTVITDSKGQFLKQPDHVLSVIASASQNSQEGIQAFVLLPSSKGSKVEKISVMEKSGSEVPLEQWITKSFPNSRVTRVDDELRLEIPAHAADRTPRLAPAEVSKGVAVFREI